MQILYKSWYYGFCLITNLTINKDTPAWHNKAGRRGRRERRGLVLMCDAGSVSWEIMMGTEEWMQYSDVNQSSFSLYHSLSLSLSLSLFPCLPFRVLFLCSSYSLSSPSSPPPLPALLLCPYLSLSPSLSLSPHQLQQRSSEPL